MSGRHKMPPAGRRKAAADSVEPAEQAAAPEVVETEPETPEPVRVEPASDEPTSVEPEAAGETVADETVEDEGVEEAAEEPADVEEPVEAEQRPRARSRVSAAVVLAAVALVLALAAGVLRWQIASHNASDVARAESAEAARDITVQMLSYETETVEEQLNAVRERLTGNFLGSYTAMTDEIIPAARAQQIAAIADVPRIGVVNAEPDNADLVLFVNQAVQVGGQMPQKTPSVVRVTMVKDGDRWLMSEYEPVPM
ncbi:hypothetical protein ABQF34_07525 [Mycolicibacterium boenickei]